MRPEEAYRHSLSAFHIVGIFNPEAWAGPPRDIGEDIQDVIAPGVLPRIAGWPDPTADRTGLRLEHLSRMASGIVLGYCSGSWLDPHAIAGVVCRFAAMTYILRLTTDLAVLESDTLPPP